MIIRQFSIHLSYIQMHTSREHQRKWHLILLKCLHKTVKASWSTHTDPCVFYSEGRSHFLALTKMCSTKSPLEETLKTFHPTWLRMKMLSGIYGLTFRMPLIWVLLLKWKMFLRALIVVMLEVLALQEAVCAFLITLELTVKHILLLASCHLKGCITL